MLAPRHPCTAALLTLLVSLQSAQEAEYADALPLTSGRPLPASQSCYDVRHYDLAVRVDPGRQRIEGRLRMRARALADADRITLDLDGRLAVQSVSRVRGADLGSEERLEDLSFRHEAGEIRIPLGIRSGEDFTLEVVYGGSPRVAPRAPWDGGFVWSKTADGSPWIATANQMQGADLWWPCKDQPGDEPDGMDISVTVPEGLVCASNGRLLGSRTEAGWTTWDWRVSTPINAYGVALNIAPYRVLTTTYTSTAGERFPVSYWVLPENFEQGKVLFADILRQVRFFEETFGPYPFRADKYGVVETPHLGMEHQSIIAYGNQYRGNPWGEQRGFDFLHHHEMAHEWWANLVTARDWKDFWIHEGFATYAQALYVERLHGPELYRAELLSYRDTLRNEGPLSPRGTASSADIYFGPQGGDIYNKGSWVLHSLRFVLGDEVFFRALRRMAYPDPALEKTSDGSACRFTDSEEIRAIAERVSGQPLAWFFEVYVYRAELPRLVVERDGAELALRWEVAGELPFPMPVELEISKERRRVVPGRAGIRVPLPADATWTVDPDHWLLREQE